MDLEEQSKANIIMLKKKIDLAGHWRTECPLTKIILRSQSNQSAMEGPCV